MLLQQQALNLGTIFSNMWHFQNTLQFPTESEFSYNCPIVMVTNVKLVIWLGLHKLIDYYVNCLPNITLTLSFTP
jgi:hypothetical protein